MRGAASTRDSDEKRIREFIQSMGSDAQFEDFADGVRHTTFSYRGTTVDVYVLADTGSLLISIAFAYMNPKTAAPFMRRLLQLNTTLIGTSFGVQEDEIVVINASRMLEGIDLEEFRTLCEAVIGLFWEYGTGLTREFQLDTQQQ